MSLNHSSPVSPISGSEREFVTNNDARLYQKFNVSSFDLPRNVEGTTGVSMQSAFEQNPSDSDSEEDEIEKHRARQIRRKNTLSKDYTDDEETAVIRKFDRKLVIFLAFLYMLSFLDRSSAHTVSPPKHNG